VLWSWRGDERGCVGWSGQVVLIALGTLRCAKLIKFVSQTVLSAFVSGAALYLALVQVMSSTPQPPPGSPPTRLTSFLIDTAVGSDEEHLRRAPPAAAVRLPAERAAGHLRAHRAGPREPVLHHHGVDGVCGALRVQALARRLPAHARAVCAAGLPRVAHPLAVHHALRHRRGVGGVLGVQAGGGGHPPSGARARGLSAAAGPAPGQV
jgi:hypothetical protein